MKLAYAVLAWGIIALGIVHMAATFLYFDQLTASALWFFSGGIAIVLTGALNLLHRGYGRIAPGLRAVCLMTNVLMTTFAAAVGIATRAGVGSFVVVLGLVGGATILSFAQRSLVERAGS